MYKFFSDIKRFLTIWQYLKAENLVLELDKRVTAADYEIFFEYKPFQETVYAHKLKEREEKAGVLEHLQKSHTMEGLS